MQNTTIEIPKSILTKSQFKTWKKTYTKGKDVYSITATVRYDDQCGNGHNSFSITADIRCNSREYMGGCCHDEVAKHFPELAPFIKWHLTSSDGPMHYVANTCYHAIDRDYNGLLKGEKRQLQNGRSGLNVWERIIRNESGEIVCTGSSSWVHSAKMPVEKLTASFEPVWIVGEGKPRELNHARSTAVWPDATDEDLTAPGLEQRLMDRLPSLLAEFKAAVESLGFTF